MNAACGINIPAWTPTYSLTFLAGAELDPVVFRQQWKQTCVIGLISFGAPFLGCTALARWGLGWSPEASWLAGVAMSTTSVAVVYAVMLEFGLNATPYGKLVLAAWCCVRSRHRRDARTDLRALYDQDADFRPARLWRPSLRCRGRRRASSGATAAGHRNWRRSS